MSTTPELLELAKNAEDRFHSRSPLDVIMKAKLTDLALLFKSLKEKNG